MTTATPTSTRDSADDSDARAAAAGFADDQEGRDADIADRERVDDEDWHEDADDEDWDDDLDLDLDGHDDEDDGLGGRDLD